MKADASTSSDVLNTHRDAAAPMAADLWPRLSREAAHASAAEPLLRRMFVNAVLDHESLAVALAGLLAAKLATEDVGAHALAAEAAAALATEAVLACVAADLLAIQARDPASDGLLTPFLHFKGFHAVATHRVAHWLWRDGRVHAARFLQGRSAAVFAVDIHPAVPVGRGVFVDHGTGLVVGETAVIGNDVSILQEVTLGGTGKERGDRHPKVHDGVLLSAGAKVLGNIVIGRGAKVGAGSVVLHDVPACATVAGVPARIVGWCRDAIPGLAMD